MTVFDTIVAECTAPYKAAISVLRLTGPEAFKIGQNVIKKDLKSFEPRKAYFCGIYKNKGEEKTLIDKGLVILFKGKESYAGEDSLEFYVHGSRLIVNQLLEALIGFGARRAEGGEFSFKAYVNGKMDLTEAEAVNSLINARTERSEKYALESLLGGSSAKIKQMKDRLNLLSAEIETDIDYPEFDQEADLIKKISELVPDLLKSSEELERKSKQSEYLFNGIKVAIIGEPNVGKSTLLNKILDEEKAIVTPIPGTTRDVVEGEREIDGIIYKFFDTAGIRKQAGSIEEIGIQKTFEVCKKADAVLILSEKGSSKKEAEKLGVSDLIKDKPVIYVSTKADLNGQDEQADISVSKDDQSLVPLFKLIEKKLDIDEASDEGLASKRDIDILTKFNLILNSIMDDIQAGITVDVCEVKLIEATSCLDEMLGNEQTMEDIYNTVFAHFCVGK